MTTNQELTDLLALELGVEFINRRPYAREIFNYYGIELLPHSSADTLIGEIYDRNHRNWLTDDKNIIGYITNGDANLMNNLFKELKNIPKEIAILPDFDFSKEDIIDLGFKIPALFDIAFTGKVTNSKSLSVKVNAVKKARINNYQAPGVELYRLLSQFASQNSTEYRNQIKSKYLAKALFYASSVEIELEKDANVEIGISFDPSPEINVEVKADTETKKKYVLSYKNAEQAPFAASFVKGKEF